jgi:homogentisate 1,2-dioxygenase
VTFEAAGFVVLSIVPQIAVADLEAEELPSYHRNIDMDEVMLSHADEDPGGRRPGNFRHTPQGILHGASEAYRAELQARRQPTSVCVDTYRPLRPTRSSCVWRNDFRSPCWSCHCEPREAISGR